MVKLKEAEKKQATQEASKGKQEKNREAKAKKVDAKVDAKSEVKTESVLAKTATLQDLDIIIHPLVTEKAVNMIEAENKLTFIVHDNASKPEIKRILEKVYGIKVVKVNVIRDMKGRKKAIVKLDKKFKASELATKLGVL